MRNPFFMPQTLDEVRNTPVEHDEKLSPARRQLRWAERMLLEEERLVVSGERERQSDAKEGSSSAAFALDVDVGPGRSGMGMDHRGNKVHLDPLAQRHVSMWLQLCTHPSTSLGWGCVLNLRWR